MTRTEQARLVLEVLVQMKDCLDHDKTYTTVLGKSFNLTRQNGICWHVFANTPNSDLTGIDIEFLQPVFVEMGLHSNYPVEMQLVNDESIARQLYLSQRNLLVLDSEPGKLRYKLLCDLINYFEKEVAEVNPVV